MRYLTQSILKMPKRKKASHKGDFGTVMIIGGSADFAGAPILAATAAKSVLRAGADIAKLAAPAKVAWAANALSPDIITKKYKGDYFTMRHSNDIIKEARKADVIQIGCGIGRKKETMAFIKKVVKNLTRMKKPMVIDADALKAIRLQDVDNSILTPHRKEFEILLKNSRLKSDDYRKKLRNNVMLLKGPIDMIVSKDKIAYNSTGNPVMTKGGTGDVLAGLCAGFLAQTRDLFRSACMAAYLNGKVGDYLLKKRGRTFIASDIVENLHLVLR
ncbi:NAD(P)H-hydrate dehydratase [Candidatus Woesearchaeota archaeon CG10_big_fil_rev_8_21_14_0_10_44_13]|nr:MAG: NAD(P)H-hydrate dehydratase [Candidatus Woesearchaeota archaeon CG10_big_fil_rev_8_21_14_0_10_44_13]